MKTVDKKYCGLQNCTLLLAVTNNIKIQIIHPGIPMTKTHHHYLDRKQKKVCSVLKKHYQCLKCRGNNQYLYCVTYLTPFFLSKAGTIEAGCSAIRDTNNCKTSSKLSSCKIMKNNATS